MAQAVVSATPAPVPAPLGEQVLERLPKVSDNARIPVVVGMVVFILFFGCLVGWAAFAPLDSAVLSNGVIKVQGNRQTLQHLDGGIIKEILVHDGDRVKEGQVLIRLDDTMARANVDLLQGQYDAYKSLEGRLSSERDEHETIAFDPELARRRTSELQLDQLMRAQENVFEARRRSMSGQIAVLNQRIAQLNEQIVGYQAQAKSNEQQLIFTREELSGTEKLNASGYAPYTKVLALKRQAAYLDGQRGEQVANIARARQQIGEAELQILQLRRDRLSEVSDQLRDAQSKLFDIEPRLRTARDTLERTNLVAPRAGYVVASTVFTVGGVIGRGERILDIVPVETPMIVEGQIQPTEVDDVKPGMRAEIHLTAFKQRVTPMIHGEILTVSADRFQDQRTGQSYYTVTLDVDEKELAETKNIYLAPGMPADIVIPLRPRTALDYILSPLTQTFDHAFREQ